MASPLFRGQTLPNSAPLGPIKPLTPSDDSRRVHGPVLLGLDRLGLDPTGPVLHGPARHGPVHPGQVLHGRAPHGPVHPGRAHHGPARLGLATAGAELRTRQRARRPLVSGESDGWMRAATSDRVRPGLGFWQLQIPGRL